MMTEKIRQLKSIANAWAGEWVRSNQTPPYLNQHFVLAVSDIDVNTDVLSHTLI